MPALVTPFDAMGRIDEAGFRQNIELCIGYGMTGLLVAGCTGEFWSMTTEERVATFKIGVDQARGRVPVLAGTGAVRTEEVIELSQRARDVGCDGILVLPPYFLKLSPEDIVAHYEAVSDAVDLPMALYNIPGNAGNDLTPRLVDRLADIKTVVAIKESSGNFNQFCKTLAVCRDRLHVFVGPAALYGVAATAMGAAGYIDTVPNLWGRESGEFYEAAVARDRDRARIRQDKSIVMRELLNGNGRNYYASLKAAMNLVGLPGGWPRRPLRPLRGAQLAELRAGLEALDFKCEAVAAE
jgi:4-hydroxy-tetrahydrodipicolinate synthase